MAEVDLSPAQDRGVLKEIIKEGAGDATPTAGCKVKVHYVGTLLDGTQFDSSRDRDKSFKFNLGSGNVIKGWDIGVATMKKGEIATLTCAPEYAYGNNGSPPLIPADATLKFEIELLDWSGEDLSPNKDKGIERFQIVAGQSYTNPEEGSSVKIHLVGKYNDQVFEDRDVEFVLGEGEVAGIIEGVETALQRFLKGEKSRLLIKSKYAFKEKGNSEYNIPPNADVEYEVELQNFEKETSVWSMKPLEKLEQAKMQKEKGTKYLTSDKINLAIKVYQKVFKYLNDESGFEDDLKKEKDSLLVAAHLNLALCYLKTNENLLARDECAKALELDPQNEKALFRRGQAHLGLASPEIAITDFQEVLKVQPKNTAASKQILICNSLIKKQLAKEKKLYANMFDKFAQEDKQKEEQKLKELPDVMHGTLGEWGQEERPGGRDATAFEKENPNILMLNANGSGEFKNM
ncbi:PREDICTED: FK506-binding protein 59 isoform X1 [Wasmannia auropunctata]|uniref:FK506-binding protein 59 isoform X1 n=2 Tax=Wasmannia auropunctata TaxID=64793 RepID=UPI0005F094B7|nr:PREDICTED: FK506-binding protein 59 isoform X1 [Wasmannia auropunctata]XP_011692860.1 PREDICTED: FK506-binding protein 59 isoform X1 [Wasmannia auropunctata]XP_011692861.1 PREDICTED: FK506-binding protein 59 isoform X1 [Wasmannia auropunctata]